MSLVYFHIFLIFCATLFSFALGVFEILTYRTSHQMIDLVTGVGAILTGTGLFIYWIWFISKKLPSMRGK